MDRRLAGALAAALLFVIFLVPSTALDEVAIHEIQFTTAPDGVSPHVDQLVTTGGVVTAHYPGGYVLQEPVSNPWTGIYVADDAHQPPLGSFCVLGAQVVEQAGMTMLRDVSSFTIINTGNPLPQPVPVQTADIAPGSPTAESFEGVFIKIGKARIVGTSPDNRWQIQDSSGVVALVGNRAGYAYDPQTGNDLASLQGVLFGQGASYLVQPRGDLDIIPISPRPSVTGVISLERREDLAGVVVELSGLPTTLTKSDGTYTIESVPPGTYTVRAYAPGYLVAERHGIQILPGHMISLPPLTLVGGDANGDGRIDLLDLTLVARNFGGCPPVDEWADVNRDGCVNLTDLVLVSQNYNKVGPTPW
jgi:hypothetical protein